MKRYIYQLLVIAFLVLSSNLYAQLSLEVNVHTGLQTTHPILGTIGAGAAPEFKLANLAVHAYAEVDYYKIEYIDQTLSYKEYNYGAGARWYFNHIFAQARVGKAFRYYNELEDDFWRVGGGIGAQKGRLTYSLSYYKYLQIERELTVLTLGFKF